MYAYYIPVLPINPSESYTLDLLMFHIGGGPLFKFKVLWKAVRKSPWSNLFLSELFKLETPYLRAPGGHFKPEAKKKGKDMFIGWLFVHTHTHAGWCSLTCMLIFQSDVLNVGCTSAINEHLYHTWQIVWRMCNQNSCTLETLHVIKHYHNQWS